MALPETMPVLTADAIGKGAFFYGTNSFAAPHELRPVKTCLMGACLLGTGIGNEDRKQFHSLTFREYVRASNWATRRARDMQHDYPELFQAILESIVEYYWKLETLGVRLFLRTDGTIWDAERALMEFRLGGRKGDYNRVIYLFNDSNPVDVVADVWNNAMERLGYVRYRGVYRMPQKVNLLPYYPELAPMHLEAVIAV